MVFNPGLKRIVNSRFAFRATAAAARSLVGRRRRRSGKGSGWRKRHCFEWVEGLEEKEEEKREKTREKAVLYRRGYSHTAPYGSRK